MKSTGKDTKIYALDGNEFTYLEYNEKELGKTMISHINYIFDKGKVILVGEKRRNGVKVDMVNLTIAKALSKDDTFMLLDEAHIEPKETIYLAAHGVLRTRTIDGRKLEDIAKLLVEAGFNGSQRIVSFACDLDKKDKHTKTMRDELRRYLELELARKSLFVSENKIDITSYANGKTILLEAQTERKETELGNGEGDLWIVNAGAYFQTRIALMAQKFLMYVGNYFKTIKYTSLDEQGRYELSKLTYREECAAEDMNSFKFGLVNYFMQDNLSDLLFGPFSLSVILNVMQVALTVVLALMGIYSLGTGIALASTLAYRTVASAIVIVLISLMVGRRGRQPEFLVTAITVFIPTAIWIFAEPNLVKVIHYIWIAHGVGFMCKWLKAMWF